MLINSLPIAYKAQTPMFGRASQAKIDAFMEKNDLEIRYTDHPNPGLGFDPYVSAYLAKKGLLTQETNGDITTRRYVQLFNAEDPRDDLHRAEGPAKEKAKENLFKKWPEKGIYSYVTETREGKTVDFSNK